MEQLLFAVVTNENMRNEKAIEAYIVERIFLGAPWLCWFTDSDK